MQLIIDAIKRFFKPVNYLRGKYTPKKDPSEEMFDHLREKGCLDCGSHDFLEGPSASIAVNIKCDNCGSEYNIAPMMRFAERIRHVPK